MEEVIRKTQNHDGDAVAFDEARDLLNSAVWTLSHTKENLHTWWTGSLRDQVWRQIHMAETYIVSRLPDAERQRRVAEILFDARVILDHDDPVMKGEPADFSAPSTGKRANNHAGRGGWRHQEKVVHETPEETAKRVYAKELVRRYREAWDDRYTASRAFRNRLIVLIAVVTIAVAILITAGSLGMITLEAPPAHATLTPELNHFLTMFTIAVLGSIGGLISGAGEVVKVGGVYNPFSLPWYLLFFKMPMGALTGILGVLAIKGDLLPDMKITMNNWSQIIIWALVFGASQQLITFMVDRRVRALSTNTPQEHVVNS